MEIKNVQDDIQNMKEQIAKLEKGILKEYKLDVVKVLDQTLAADA
jgi:hypothetical protein